MLIESQTVLHLLGIWNLHKHLKIHDNSDFLISILNLFFLKHFFFL